jgi:hypothetical protein
MPMDYRRTSYKYMVKYICTTFSGVRSVPVHIKNAAHIFTFAHLFFFWIPMTAK